MGCLAGAVMRDEYLSAIRNAGFIDVRIIDNFKIPVGAIKDIADSIVSMKIQEIKPG